MSEFNFKNYAPEIRVVAIDETRNWGDEVTAVTGRVWGIYAFDANQVTFLCSLEPNYWMRHIINVAENNSYEAWELVQGGIGDDDYYLGSTVLNMPYHLYDHSTELEEALDGYLAGDFDDEGIGADMFAEQLFWNLVVEYLESNDVYSHLCEQKEMR